LINYWPLNGDINDHIGSADLTSGGGSYSYMLNHNNQANAAVYLGDQAYFSMPTGIFIMTTFSVMGWVYLNMSNSVSFFQASSDSSGTDNFWLQVQNYPYARFFSGSNNSPSFSSNLQLALNTWTHIAFTFDGSVGILYMNGVSQGQTTSTFAPTAVSCTDNYWGVQGITPGGAGDGNIGLDEVRFYNLAVSQSQIQAIMSL
jgi:hypothetical protein